MSHVKRIGLIDSQVKTSKQDIVEITSLLMYLKRYNVNPLLIISFIELMEGFKFPKNGFSLENSFENKVKLLSSKEFFHKLIAIRVKISDLTEVYKSINEINSYLYTKDQNGLLGFSKKISNLDDFHRKISFDFRIHIETENYQSDFDYHVKEVMNQLSLTIDLIDLITESESSPVYMERWFSYLGENKRFYDSWFFNGIIYHVDMKIFSEEEASLLVINEFDKERRSFEVMKNKLNTLEINSEVKREKIPENVRIEVWRRDGGKCAKCSSRERLEYDHIIPVSRGGSNTARNIELLCEKCNRSKGASIS